jgi:hypothetical protein
MKMIYNLLSSNEITEIVNNPIVEINREKLATLQTVDFSIELSDEIKTKLETGLDIHLSQITSIPMRWIKGDSVPHIDKGDAHFHKTYLVYLTDSIGNLFVDGISYPITAGDAHIFSEGIEHYTINTGDSERLLIGPMSEMGFQVGGGPYIYYFDNETDAENFTNYIGFDISSTFIIQTINGISSWNITTNSTVPSSLVAPYNTGDVFDNTGYYSLYPYVEPTTTTTTTRSFSMKSLFTDNARVYYKPHSLSTGGGGSGVKNHRLKQRRT